MTDRRDTYVVPGVPPPLSLDDVGLLLYPPPSHVAGHDHSEAAEDEGVALTEELGPLEQRKLLVHHDEYLKSEIEISLVIGLRVEAFHSFSEAGLHLGTVYILICGRNLIPVTNKS